MKVIYLNFRPYFHYCLSSAHHCEDHFHPRLYPQFRYMTIIYSLPSKLEIVGKFFFVSTLRNVLEISRENLHTDVRVERVKTS